jgi:hypothetical protein
MRADGGPETGKGPGADAPGDAAHGFDQLAVEIGGQG